MPNFGYLVTVVLRAPGNVNLSAVRQLFPSITLTSRRRSPRGDDNLDEAELYIDITEKQLDAIYKASVQATETSAEEIKQIEYELDDINYLIDTAKKARAGRSMLNQTLRNLGDDATTKNILKAARELAKKAKRTSARVVLADSSSTTVGLSFSFDRQPNADDTRKINHFARLVNLDSDDTAEESESVRGLRSRRSDLSTFSYRYWGLDAYESGESSVSSDSTNSPLSPLSRTSSGMLLGDRPIFHQCHFNISNIQSNDNSTVSDATANLGVTAAGRDRSCAPVRQPAVRGSSCPACSGFQGVGTIQTEGTSLQDAAAADMLSFSDQYNSATLSSEAQNDIPVVPTMQPLSRTRPDEAEIQQALHLTAGAEHIQSHSMLIHGPAMVSSPTMNLNSSGSTGATNTYLSGQSAHCSLSTASPSRSPEGPRYQCSQCMEASGNPTV